MRKVRASNLPLSGRKSMPLHQGFYDRITDMIRSLDLVLVDEVKKGSKEGNIIFSWHMRVTTVNR